jgi:hypothetical protein
MPMTFAARRLLRRAAIAVAATAAAIAPTTALSAVSAVSVHADAAPHPYPHTAQVRAAQWYGRFGVVPQRTSKHAAASGITPDTPPSAGGGTLSYAGGPIESYPQVILDFWGSQWASDANGVQAYLVGFFGGVGGLSDTWSTTMAQYPGGGVAPAFGTPVLAGTWVDGAAPAPSNAGGTDLGTEANNAAAHFGVSGPDVNVIVVSPSGTHPDNFPNGGFCAWHSYNGNVAYTNMPYVLDAGGSCGADSVRSQLDGFSIVAGHEYAEAVTDPEPASGWNNSANGEIADECAWYDLGALNLTTGAYAVQPLWSNSSGGCVRTGATSPAGSAQQLTGTGSNRCLDIQSFGTTDGTPVQLWDCSGNWNQKWSFTNGTFVNPQSGKCLDVAGGAAGNGTQVRLWTCDGAGAQQWRIAPDGNLVNPQSGRCLDVDGAATGNGSALDIWDCGASQTNQTWSAGPHQLIGTGSNRCLDVAGGATADGTATNLWDCTGAANQQWTLTAGRLVNPQSGKCLDVAGSGTANGTQVRLWSCNGYGAQQWTALPDGNLVNPESGRCLDVDAWATANGSPVEIWDCGANQSNQTWHFS